MTARKSIEPVRCACGRKAEYIHYKKTHLVCCSNSVCWYGPVRTTRRAAVLAWNRVMAVVARVNKMAGSMRRRRHA